MGIALFVKLAIKTTDNSDMYSREFPVGNALFFFISAQLAAGAMLYVVVEELIPKMSQGQHSNVGTVFFAVGFSVMMVLDVALG